MSKDYYSILGVDKGADEKEIKKSYRKLSKQYHPDVNPDDKSAEEKFKEIADAYSVLSDPQKKSNYDQFGSADGNPYGGGDPFSGGGMGDIFDQFFGGGQRRRKPTGASGRCGARHTLCSRSVTKSQHQTRGCDQFGRCTVTDNNTVGHEIVGMRSCLRHDRYQ